MVVGMRSDGDEGRSYDGTTILGEEVAQSRSRGGSGLLGVNGKTSILNRERDNVQSSQEQHSPKPIIALV
jgi:hypothetical protein